MASVSCCPRVTHLIYKKDDDSPCEGTDLKSLLEWPDDSEPQVDIKGEDESVILYTSGTTGRSKGVMHTQQMVREYSYMMALESDPPNTPSSVLVQSPIFHLGGMQHIWRMAALSGTLVMVNKFLPEEILSAIEQYHVNELYVLPPILIKRLYDFPRWKEYDLSSVRCVMCTGGKCSQDIANMIFELFPGSKIDCVFGSALHGGVECVMRCPELALHGRGVADEDVEALDLLGQLRDLLHLFHDGVIVLALKGEHERRADALAVHLDREHGVAGNIAGELHNVGIHVLDDGGGIVLCQQGVGGIEAGLGIHEREE